MDELEPEPLEELDPEPLEELLVLPEPEPDAEEADEPALAVPLDEDDPLG